MKFKLVVDFDTSMIQDDQGKPMADAPKQVMQTLLEVAELSAIVENVAIEEV